MTAQIIAAWAEQNGFNLLDSWKYRRNDEARTITIEIKRLSVVLIDERHGARPRIVSTLFKDLFFGSPNSKLEQLLPHRSAVPEDPVLAIVGYPMRAMANL